MKAAILPADLGVGFFNGVLGGATGLAEIIIVIWSQLRGWTKDQQRTVFQPVGVATFAMSAAWLGGQGSISRDVLQLFVVALPVCSPVLGFDSSSTAGSMRFSFASLCWSCCLRLAPRCCFVSSEVTLRV
jgi:hypothetical protein